MIIDAGFFASFAVIACSHDYCWHSLEECNPDASNNRATYDLPLLARSLELRSLQLFLRRTMLVRPELSRRAAIWRGRAPSFLRAPALCRPVSAAITAPAALASIYGSSLKLERDADLGLCFCFGRSLLLRSLHPQDGAQGTEYRRRRRINDWQNRNSSGSSGRQRTAAFSFSARSRRDL